MAEFDLLVTGAGRGGTTLLASMLDAHPELMCELEFWAKRCLMQDPRRKLTCGQGFINKCKQRAQVRRIKGRWGNKILTFNIRGLLDDFDFENKMWTREISLQENIAMLDKFFNEQLKGVQVIFIIRDGRSCVASLMKRSRFSLETACSSWKYSAQVGAFIASRPNSLIVRYEELVLEPELTCKQVCSFLGVVYDEIMLTGAVNPKGYKEVGFNEARVVPPKIPQKVLQLIQNELQLYGYK